MQNINRNKNKKLKIVELESFWVWGRRYLFTVWRNKGFLSLNSRPIVMRYVVNEIWLFFNALKEVEDWRRDYRSVTYYQPKKHTKVKIGSYAKRENNSQKPVSPSIRLQWNEESKKKRRSQQKMALLEFLKFKTLWIEFGR
jgi:hypothetical protein